MTAVVEARGVLCPVPIIRLARAAAERPPGSHIALLTDDPAAMHDVPAWCRLRGHTLLASAPLPHGSGGGGGSPAARAVPPTGQEPHVPNPRPGQAVRHLIRLGPDAPG